MKPRRGKKLLVLLAGLLAFLFLLTGLGIPWLISRGYFLAPYLNDLASNAGLDLSLNRITLRSLRMLELEGVELCFKGEDPFITVARVVVRFTPFQLASKRVGEIVLEDPRFVLDLESVEKYKSLLESMDLPEKGTGLRFGRMEILRAKGVFQRGGRTWELPPFRLESWESGGSIPPRFTLGMGEEKEVLFVEGSLDSQGGHLHARGRVKGADLKGVEERSLFLLGREMPLTYAVAGGELWGRFSMGIDEEMGALSWKGEVFNLGVRMEEEILGIGSAGGSLDLRREGGAFSAKFSVDSGEWGRAKGEVDFCLSPFSVAKAEVDLLDLPLDLAAKIFKDSALPLPTKGRLGFHGTFESNGCGDCGVEGALQFTSLSSLGEEGSLSYREGKGEARVSLKKGKGEERWAGSVSGRMGMKLGWRGDEFTVPEGTSLSVEGSYFPGEASLERITFKVGDLLGGSWRGEGEVSHLFEDPLFEFKAWGEDFAVDQVMALVSKRFWKGSGEWSGRGNVEIQAGGKSGELSLEGRASLNSLSMKSQDVLMERGEGEMKFRLEGEKALAFTLDRFGGHLRVSGDMNLELQPEGRLRGDWSFREGTLGVEDLEIVLPPLGEMKGRFSIHLPSLCLQDGQLCLASLSLEKCKEWAVEKGLDLLPEWGTCKGRAALFLEIPSLLLGEGKGEARVKGTLSDGEFAFEEGGLEGVKGIGGAFEAEVRADEKRVGFRMEGRVDQLELFLGSFYRKLEEEFVQASLEGEWERSSGRWQLKRGLLQSPETGRVTFAGTASGSLEDPQADISFDFSGMQLRKAFETFVRERLQESYPILSEIRLQGECSGRARVRAEGGRIQIEGGMELSGKEIAIPSVGLSGIEIHLPLSLVREDGTWGGAPQEGRVSIQKVRVQDTEGEGGEWSFSLRGDSLRFNGELRFPLFEGEVVMRNIALEGILSPSRKISFSAFSSPIGMESICRGLKLPPLEGTLSISIPSAVFDAHRMDLWGEIQMEAFGGRGVLEGFHIQDPFSTTIKLVADSCTAKDILLEDLSRYMNMGFISGNLEGRIQNLIFSSGELYGFEADFQAVPREGVSQCINREGIVNIQRILTGESYRTLKQALDRSIFKIYHYRNFGFRCRLENDKFYFKGKYLRGGKEYIMMGGWYGIKQINIIHGNPKPVYRWQSIYRNIQKVFQEKRKPTVEVRL